MATKLLLSSLLLGLTLGAGQGNPFLNADFFANPDYAKEVASSIALHPSQSKIMNQVGQQAAAFWMDKMAHIQNASDLLESAMNHVKQTGNATVVALIVYDVPDRDCSAGASAGEFKCSDSACADGINDYKTKYIAPIVSMLNKYTDEKLRIVLIIEPDSLPNLATNLNVPECQQAQTAYKTCIAYAIQTLSQQPNTYLYVDAAHGGWLGWQNNMEKFAPIVKEVLTMAGGPSLIRGFADNVANYQWLGALSDNADPCDFQSQYNFCNNEAVYMSKMNQELESVIGGQFYWVHDSGRNGQENARDNADPCDFQSQYNFCNNEAVYMSKMNQELESVIGGQFYWVHDSGRNGQENARVGTTQCSNWCNIKNAGLGYKPTTDVAFTGIESILDALFWLKTPGESDGTTNKTSPFFDTDCVSQNALQPAPEAGDWFDPDFSMLCSNSIWNV
eukprot:CAMPEP_0114691806 /NCGR_PEP_ID=MMETSP0191-20121206/67236_1 /TAXON_ID=126664 /ORGANISM="Sorites sp." /LENGTH=447 /DNA_ID=CAMNT_0001983437 /DNA_START=60 /DNA_END=1403 /DNA_ORIENTATION=-